MKVVSRIFILIGVFAENLLLAGLGGCDAGKSPPEPGASGGPPVRGAVRDLGAASLEAEGRWLEAAALYRRAALAGEPPENGAAIRRALAACYMADRPADAEKLVAEIRETWPEFHEVLLYLAEFQRVTMRYDEALSTVERFLTYDPDHVQGMLVSGLILVSLGETARGLEAIETYLGHENLDPAYRAEAEVVRVRALRALGRLRDAADSVTRLLESGPLDPEVLAEAAQTYAVVGNAALARAASGQHRWLSRRGYVLTAEDPLALHRSGPRPEARVRLALQARDRREFLHAIAELRALVSGDLVGSRIGYLLGRLYLRLSRYRECRQVLDALTTDGAASSPEVLHLRALLLSREGKPREATQEWRRAIETLAAGADEGAVEEPLTILLAAADHEQETGGDLDLADRWYATAAELAPEGARPVAGRAWIAIRKGDLERAQVLLAGLARRVDPETSQDYVRLDGTIRGLGGDLRVAARQLTSLIVKRPEDELNFTAFMTVFGDKSDVPEVMQVGRLRDEWRAKRRAVEEAAKQVSARPLEEAGGEYLHLGRLAAGARDRDRALDAFMIAAELDPESTESLKAALEILDKTSDVFLRLAIMRRIVGRDAVDVEILELLARTYLDLRVRLGEAERIAARLVSLRPGAASDGLLRDVRAKVR